MSHSVEDYYKKIQVLHTKGLELHRERYKTQGSYDKVKCEALVDDIRALATDIKHGLLDLDIDFGKQK